MQKEFINTDFGPVCVKFTAAGTDRPFLLLHDAGASSQSLDVLAAGLSRQCAGERQIISVDLPGHGDTGAVRLSEFSIDNMAKLLAAVIENLGVEDLDVVAVGAACSAAVALANSSAALKARLLLIDPWLFTEDERNVLAESYAPDLEPRQNGQHFLSAWTFARDSELFRPWHTCKAANALQRAPEIQPEQTHARTVDALKAGPAFACFVQAAAAEDFAKALTSLEAPVLIFARQGNGHEKCAEEAARICPNATYNRLPAAISDWAGEIIELLNTKD